MAVGEESRQAVCACFILRSEEETFVSAMQFRIGLWCVPCKVVFRDDVFVLREKRRREGGIARGLQQEIIAGHVELHQFLGFVLGFREHGNDGVRHFITSFHFVLSIDRVRQEVKTFRNAKIRKYHQIS